MTPHPTKPDEALRSEAEEEYKKFAAESEIESELGDDEEAKLAGRLLFVAVYIAAAGPRDARIAELEAKLENAMRFLERGVSYPVHVASLHQDIKAYLASMKGVGESEEESDG